MFSNGCWAWIWYRLRSLILDLVPAQSLNLDLVPADCCEPGPLWSQRNSFSLCFPSPGIFIAMRYIGYLAHLSDKTLCYNFVEMTQKSCFLMVAEPGFGTGSGASSWIWSWLTAVNNFFWLGISVLASRVSASFRHSNPKKISPQDTHNCLWVISSMCQFQACNWSFSPSI